MPGKMSRLRAVCCRRALTEPISVLFFVSLPCYFQLAGTSGGFSPAQVLQPELLSELVADQGGVPAAQLSIHVHQGPDLRDGELGGTETGVHICFVHHLVRERAAPRLGEQHSGEKDHGEHEEKSSRRFLHPGRFDI